MPKCDFLRTPLDSCFCYATHLWSRIKLQSSANYLEQIKENVAKETVLENLISVFACLFLRCYLTYF